eukprot:7520510-Pyramimonas_sp.AAC.1
MCTFLVRGGHVLCSLPKRPPEAKILKNTKRRSKAAPRGYGAYQKRPRRPKSFNNTKFFNVG